MISSCKPDSAASRACTTGHSTSPAATMAGGAKEITAVSIYGGTAVLLVAIGTVVLRQDLDREMNLIAMKLARQGRPHQPAGSGSLRCSRAPCSESPWHRAH